jgi:large subunit ribosomal protein L1
MDDLAATVKSGEMNFDVVIASPDAMRVVGQLGPNTGAERFDAQPQGRYSNARCGTAVKMRKLVR